MKSLRPKIYVNLAMTGGVLANQSPLIFREDYNNAYGLLGALVNQVETELHRSVQRK